MTTNHTVTRLLEAGDAENLLPILYTRLDAFVRMQVRHGPSLRPYRIVHRLWLELLGDAEERWRWRGRLLAMAASPVRRVLVHHARQLTPRGQQLDVDLVGWPMRGACLDVLEFDAALVRVALNDELRARLIELRDLAGLSIDEAAQALDVTPETALREWSWARTGLMRDLGVLPVPSTPPQPAATGSRGIQR